MREGLLNIMVVGSADAIVMIESGAERSERRDGGGRDRVRPRGNQEDLRRDQRTAREGRQAESAKITPPEFDEAYFKGLEKKVGARLADALDERETSEGGKLRTGARDREGTARRRARRRQCRGG